MGLPQHASRRGGASQQGAVAIVVSLSMVALLLASALVLDFGLVRMDRQQNKLAADSAVMAGLRAADVGTTDVHTFLGACGALEFLKANKPALSGLPVGICSSPSATTACDPGDATTHAVYTGSTTHSGTTYSVTIKSPYRVSDGNFAEEGYATLSSDVGSMQGCDQIGVIIAQSRRPGLGSLAKSGDLTTRVRSVGRVAVGAGDDAPAMLLLKRMGCPVLRTGSAAGGSYVHVYGAVSSTAYAQAGTIHADSDGSGCSGSILEGRGSDGVVAYAAPLTTDPSQPDPAKPGQITTVAGLNSAVGIGTVRDSAASVYASGAINEAGAGSAPRTEPTGRPLVTRRPVDQRYLSGVTDAVTGANNLFSTLNAGNAEAAGYALVSDCSPSSLPLAAAVASKVFIDCTHNNGYRGTATINAEEVVFNGKVNPAQTAGTSISMPNARKVYIFGSSQAVDIGNNATLSLHTSGRVDAATGLCSSTNTSSKAVLFVRTGEFKQTGGLLRMCNTTVMMLGGSPTGCLPAVSYLGGSEAAPAPTQSPCGAGTMGTGQFTQTGGGIDWTAPSQWDVMTLPNGSPDPSRAPSWADPNGPEDLALWSESAGNNSSTKYNMAGGGIFNVRGVFMVPNVEPFTLSGDSNLNLTNAQFIATSIELNGNNTRVSMRVDPHSAVTLPQLNPFTLVR